MLISAIEYLIDEKECTDEEELRSKVMSYFNNNKIIDAIATADISVSPPCCDQHQWWDVMFQFKRPVEVNDADK